ncbi:MAG TPA: penicillin acylase family protein [Kofleriaceae bacterium]|nr:penicillin acylase family protein [Kofleriaceae bacterium]
MTRALAFASILAAAGCGGDAPPAGPYDGVDLTVDLRVDGLDGPVHAVRDEYGIVHINATTGGDAAFVQGYVMAHDRLPQMDVLRRFGAGTLAELYGLDEDVVNTDLEMRVHRMKPIAEQAYAELQASTDADDQDIVRVLDRFADGVNAYAADLQAGKYTVDSSVRFSWDPDRFVAWSPVDSLVLGRFQAFALSWTTPLEIDITDLYQQARQVFDLADAGDADHYARRGASADLVRVAPVGRTATIDGFPNVDADTGTRSDGSGAAPRPHVSRALLASARKFLAPHMGPQGPHAFMVPHAGSNDWVVGPTLTGGKAMLAGDQHLSLPNPSIFYPTHLVVPGELDVEGITFPGIPGVVLGHNGHLAWSATVVYHDVNDVYLEQIVPCDAGGGDCVLFDGGQVPIESWTETVNVGALGTITGSIEATYERVPHHGPIIPTVDNRAVVPRTGSQALSVRYTGHQVTHEIRATYLLNRATSVQEGFAALASFEYGGQNWVMIDDAGHIAWTTQAKVPLRSAAAYAWDPETAPDAPAPFFVLPGDGSAEWEGWMDPRYIPHAIDPDKGYLATANSDPVGATFDGNPLDGPVVDGRPLYAGTTYAAGVRSERISALIEDKSAGGAMTLDDMAAIQADTQSTIGGHLLPSLIGVLDRTGRDDDAATYLRAWDLATGPDSVATSIFNVWMHFFFDRAVGDEYAELGWDVYAIEQNLSVRTVVALLAEPGSLVSGLSVDTGQPILCDDLRTPAIVDSCDDVAMAALDDAVAWLGGADGFGSDDASTWVWGGLHTLTMKPLFPEDSLNLPAPDDPDPALRHGFPRAGDNFVINRADCGWDDLDFKQDADGPAQRFLAEVEPGGTIHARMALPGGLVYDRSSPHYRDLLDDYYLPDQHFDLPYATAEIVDHGEERWLFRNR